MNSKVAFAIMAGLVAVTGGGVSQASTIPAVVNFDPPGTPQGPSIYVAVPGPQTIATTPATFSGGVALGFATFFPAISFATIPNVYGTADFGNHLSNALTVAIDPAFTTTEVSFALFNGETFNQSYTIDAFNGASLVGSQTLTNVAPNFNSGYGLVDLVALGGITKVTIVPTGAPVVWDFLIDTVAFNQNITSIVNPPPPPVVQPATPPVQGHRHGRGEGEVETVEVDFGDDVNDIRGSVLVVTPTVTTDTPEPASYMLIAAGLVAIGAGRRKGKAA
uniref:Ice-binding protein C-terminal domain-containing protein n=1 Tax=Solibacter usitatus (strain Ellin6076) TaxID=234267 RepID=Q01YQ0_SOLUE